MGQESELARHRRLRDLFLKASRLPVKDRAHFLAKQDLSTSIGEDVREMLRTSMTGFLEVPATGPSVESTLAELRGGTIGRRYRIGEEVGRGAYGVVVRAFDERRQNEVAIKFLHGPARRAMRRAARQEAASLRLLRLPGTARLMDEGEFRGTPYLVTELVEGSPFPGQAPLDWPRLHRILMGLLATLARIHDAGFIHRDLKPTNVLVGEDGTVTVLDFGIASGWGSAPTRAAGTPHYAAPEQLEQGEVGPAADLYAVGRMVEEAGEGMELPAVLEALLDPSPDARPSSASVVLASLLGVQTSDSPTSIQATIDRMGLARLDDAHLRSLIRGPERLLHLPSDGAAELERRTGGEALAVVHELESWVRSGLARWVDARLVLTREALEELRLGALPPGHVPVDEPLDVEEQRILGGLRMAWPSTGRDERALLFGPRAEAAVARLVRRGFVFLDAQGRAVALRFVTQPEGTDLEHLRQQLAVLREGADEHLLHCVKTTSGEHLAERAGRVARERLAAGQHSAAERALRTGLDACPEGPEGRERRRELLRIWARLALEEFSAPAFDRVLYELTRVEVEDEQIHGLLLAALAVSDADAEGALALLDRVTRSEDPELEAWRISLRLRALAACDPVRSREELEAARASLDGRMGAAGRLDLWEGLTRYREGDFDGAARCHLRDARRLPVLRDRLRATLNAASAWMEDGQLDRARRTAQRAARRGSEHRFVLIEGRGETLARACRYRSGEHLEPDLELVDSLRLVGSWSVEGMALITEAAVAWRVGKRSLARELAARARWTWECLGSMWPARLARGLEVAAGAAIETVEQQALTRALADCPLPRLRAQTAALLRLAGVTADAPLPEGADREHRFEILSFQEIAGNLGKVEGSPGRSAAGR